MMAGHQAEKPPSTRPADGHLALKGLDDLEASLQRAQKAVQAGDAKAAAAELANAQKALASLKEQLKSCPMAAQANVPANTHCPIMGGKIDPANVKPELTRRFKGQIIAFCCGGGPAQWDTLDDQQKQAKLDAHQPVDQKTEAKPADPHSGHQH